MSGCSSYGAHQIDDSDVRAVVEALKSERLTQGPEVVRFEEALCEAVQVPHAVAVSSGTAALHLAYAALGLGPGDEIITSPITFVATANAARMLGAEVRFADVDPATGNIEVASVERLISSRTRGIVPVHFAGSPVDMQSLHHIAERHGLWIVEDAAHALGARIGGERIGSARRSAAVVFSFHPVKTITTGEGGAVTCRDEALASRVRRSREHGLVRMGPPEAEGMWGYQLHELGFNYRLSDIHAALGRAQLQRLERWVRRRNALARLYRYRLRGVPQVQLQQIPRGQYSGYHLMSVAIDFEHLGHRRAAVMRGLRERGVGTQVHYMPVHQQPYYAARGASVSLPGAETFYARQLSLPLHVGMDGGDVQHVVNALRDVLA